MSDNGTVTITVDGIEHQVPAGLNIVQVAARVGKHVPHYCWHSALSVAGNCRMCLVKIEGARKLEIGCDTRVKEGMVLYLDHPEVAAARAEVLEYLLINHPLDCPTCDKAGECGLQDYAYRYGHDRSRMQDDKTLRPRKRFSEHVHYVGNRCIACTRCVRFCEEISGTGELAMVARGDHAQVDIFPGRPVDNLLAGNIVDICPVGALLEDEFLYRQRVWWIDSRDSVCPHCSLGCAIRLELSPELALKRIRPRPNPHVNGHFMCDIGRYQKPWALENRVLKAKSGATGQLLREDVVEVFEALRQAKSLGVAISLFSSNEEAWTVKRLCAEVFKTERIALFGQPRQEDVRFPKFTISGDRNPNRAGVTAILGAGTACGENLAGSDVVLVVGSLPDGGFGDLGAPPNSVTVIALATHEGAVTERAERVLPGSIFWEGPGSLINHDGRVQKNGRPLPPLSGRRNLDVLQRFLVLGGAANAVQEAPAIFDELAKVVPAFAGMTWQSLGAHGQTPAPQPQPR